MPQGIGPIGIYHSHPFSSKIFHSHTDDATLLSLSNQFPSCISIVTNGEDINYYQMGKNSKVVEVHAEFNTPEIPKFLLIKINETVHLKISSRILNDRVDESKLKILILNKLRDYLEDIWIEFEFSYKNSKISENDSIKPYLVRMLTSRPVQLILPKRFKKRNKIKLLVDSFGDSDDLITNQDQTHFNLNIQAKIPVYTTDENKTFQDLHHTIKTEILGNNILQKIYNCVVDYERNTVITPDDYYLNFFGFYIRNLHFDTKELNESEFSLRTFEFISRFISLYESFTNLELPNELKNQFITFFRDIKNLSQKFSWYDEMKKKLNLQ